MSNTAFITALDSNALHGAPDTGGLNGWVNALNTNVLSRSGAVLGFSESPEHIEDAAANIASNAPGVFGSKFV